MGCIEGCLMASVSSSAVCFQFEDFHNVFTLYLNIERFYIIVK